MIRMVLVLVVGVALGAVVGAAIAGPLGGVFGTIFGACFATLWQSVRKSTREIAPGATAHHEKRRLLCVGTGQFAEVGLVHDEHHWCEVESCTLCNPAEKIECRKRCLDLMNDNHPVGKVPETA